MKSITAFLYSFLVNSLFFSVLAYAGLSLLSLVYLLPVAVSAYTAFVLGITANIFAMYVTIVFQAALQTTLRQHEAEKSIMLLEVMRKANQGEEQ